MFRLQQRVMMKPTELKNSKISFTKQCKCKLILQPTYLLDVARGDDQYFVVVVYRKGVIVNYYHLFILQIEDDYITLQKQTLRYG